MLVAGLAISWVCGLVGAASVSRHVQLGSHEYFLPPQPAWSFSEWEKSLVNSDEEFIPLTVVHLNSTNRGTESIKATLDKFRWADDVWTPAFTNALYVQYPLNATSSGNNLTVSLGPDSPVDNVFTSTGKTTANKSVPQGPYFVHKYTGKVYQAYRLYPDTSQAFLQPSYQDPNGVHHNLRVATESAGGLTVAVPSRLYFTPSKSKPLAGVRIAVKDLYDLKGMKTSGGNRALFEISKPKNATAVAVQKLIDAGAIVVGKNKLSEFAFAGPYVTEHIDYLLPFNPRGDGYNSPGDSSGGSGSAVASYGWLDASMGSDTGGSIRGPATQNGVHGNRPSHGAVNLTGALVLSNSMDTSGILARDPRVWSEINKVLYSGFAKEFTKFPKKIYVNAGDVQSALSPNELIGPGSAKLVEKLNNFTEALASLVNGNTTSLSVDDLWTSSNDTGNTTLRDLTSNLYSNLTSYEQWIAFGKDYLSTYMKSHGGKYPYMVPSTLQGWQTANGSMSPDIHREDLRKKQHFTKWISQNVFKPDEETCSDSIFLYFSYPQGSQSYKPDVSDDTNNPYISQLTNQLSSAQEQVTTLNTTLNCNCTEFANQGACAEITDSSSEPQQNTAALPNRLASLGDLPDYAVTLGEIALPDLVSDASKKIEALPYGVDIVAGYGCDFMVQNLVTKLHEAGLIKNVQTGASVYGNR
ncbi:uncharacterized protein ACHE_60839S [Aspergillus chevalieri]|uniref:Amidase domain-containing protein n=1 Tax=Aspergillus chevalieri TaxID=182096 RepID=A0A7R7VVF6_ASPCH|nr:uncharacterized protein ACHE_60839S [Aspergillus chevalieri]BCR90953.1 hypothetical protein ACHE_60839S [Aspergillus chevalieri]